MAEWVNSNYAAGQSWVDLGTYADADGNDQMYGFFYNVNVKSLVWYSPDNFEDAGYEDRDPGTTAVILGRGAYATPGLVRIQAPGAAGFSRVNQSVKLPSASASSERSFT